MKIRKITEPQFISTANNSLLDRVDKDNLEITNVRQADATEFKRLRPRPFMFYIKLGTKVEYYVPILDIYA